MILNDWVQAGIFWMKLTLLLINVGRDKNRLVVELNLHIYGFHGCLGMGVLLEADESLATLIMDSSRINFSVLLEELGELRNRVVDWKVSNEKVGVFLNLLFPLIFLGVKDNLDLPITLSESIQAIDGLLGIFLLDVLNVTEASTLTVLEGFELA